MAGAVVFCLLLGVAGDGFVPAAELDLPPPEAGCHRHLEVVGFSDNERALAVLQHISCVQPDRSVDRFSLTSLIELKNRTVVATYQGSPVVRSRGKKPEFVTPKDLRANHPTWARALPQNQWVKVRRAGHFALRSHDFKDVMVRVRRDADSPMDVHVEHDTLVLTAPVGAPVGCTAVARLVDGREIDVGRVRGPAHARGQERGRLKFVFSAHGHVLALVHTSPWGDAITLTRTPNAQPVASTKVGFLQMLKWDADSVKKLFGEIHPEGKDTWDEMIGTIE